VSLLSSRWIVPSAAVVAMLVASPALTRGFKADDFIHRDYQLTRGRSGLLETLNGYFDFTRPETAGDDHSRGEGPWWTARDLRVAFFRPVTAFTHWLDYRLWPDSAFAMHLHSLLWYGLACAVVARLYRQLLGATWVAGLAVVPVCATSVPSGRLLLFCGVGAMPLVGLFLAALCSPDGYAVRRLWRLLGWVFAVSLLVLHGLLSPYTLVTTLAGPDNFQVSIERGTGFDPPTPEARIVVVNPPCVFYLVYYHTLRRSRGLEGPAYVHTLAPGHGSVSLTRTDTSTLRIHAEGGFVPAAGRHDSNGPPMHEVYLYRILDRTFRGSKSPVVVGQPFDGDGISATVTRVDSDSQPLEATIRLDRSLDDPSLFWVQWNWERGDYEPFVVPPVGGSATVPGPFAKAGSGGSS
jgi:hypothetical protein